ncbi:MAG TPA: DUF6069 family protein, partial [Dermatophilaceae bacterium]|nr:DUF6069 family protein [Dermatophilaceae bacterium]
MSGSQFWKRTGLVIAAAALVNVVVYLVATVAGVDILVPMGASPVPLSVVPVVLFTIVPLVLAAGFLLVLRRLGSSGSRVFAGVALTVMVLSLVAPMTADLTVPNKLVLATMHVVAGLAAL